MNGQWSILVWKSFGQAQWHIDRNWTAFVQLQRGADCRGSRAAPVAGAISESSASVPCFPVSLFPFWFRLVCEFLEVRARLTMLQEHLEKLQAVCFEDAGNTLHNGPLCLSFLCCGKSFKSIQPKAKCLLCKCRIEYAETVLEDVLPSIPWHFGSVFTYYLSWADQFETQRCKKKESSKSSLGDSLPV